MILLVGTADNYLIEKAKEYSNNPILITEENFEISVEVGYTGLEEFSNNDKTKLIQLLCRVDEIIYCANPAMQAGTRNYLERLLLFINQTIPVTNLKSQILISELILENSKKFLKLADIRKINNRQLWAAGCSFTYGLGVQPLERYPSLLANMLDIPTSCLAIPGSSIPWAADQILRSDIRTGDIVIWGLTNKERLNWWDNDAHQNINLHTYDMVEDLDKRLSKKLLLDDNNSTYQLLTHIYQVINFCNKVGAKLLIVGLLVYDNDFLYLCNIPEYYHYCNINNINNNNMLDYGHDGSHPGPLQHVHYAKEIYKQLELRKWI